MQQTFLEIAVECVHHRYFAFLGSKMFPGNYVTYIGGIVIVVKEKIKNALAVIEMLDLLQDPFLIISCSHISITSSLF